MGILRPEESLKVEIEEFRRMLLSCPAVHGRKNEEEFRNKGVTTRDDAIEEKLVCVTSGVSFLGLAIVNRLLLRGYSVRIIVSNEEDLEKVREMELSGEKRGANSNVTAVMAQLTELESLAEAFDGCHGVFHTAAFVDPAGLSGYSKSMADIEAKASENVMEACARTTSVRKFLLTSSLLACIWQDKSRSDLSSVIDHDSWSDEFLCINKKLWYALGKLRAEKAAWRVAEGRGLNLVTICPGLITGPEFCCSNPTGTIAYLKGAQEMYADTLLATVDVNRLAEAHIRVFEAMNKMAFGRYICFDHIIEGDDETQKLERQTGLQINIISGSGSASGNFPVQFELSNTKLSGLMSKTPEC